jgi:hypothetical protein
VKVDRDLDGSRSAAEDAGGEQASRGWWSARISAVNWVMPSWRARSASQRTSAYPMPLKSLSDQDRDLGAVAWFAIPDVAGDAQPLAREWIERKQGLVVAVVDFGQVAQLSRGQTPHAGSGTRRYMASLLASSTAAASAALSLGSIGRICGRVERGRSVAVNVASPVCSSRVL